MFLEAFISLSIQHNEHSLILQRTTLLITDNFAFVLVPSLFFLITLFLYNSIGLKYTNLKENIKDAVEKIPTEYYKNIIAGAYNRKEKYVNKHNKTRKNAKKMYL